MYHHCPDDHLFQTPNRKQNRCQEWRRCRRFLKRERQQCDPFQGCWSRWESFVVMYLHCPIGHSHPLPNRRQHRCQEWRRCGLLQKRERPKYDLFQDYWSRWVIFVAKCLRCPVGHSHPLPNRRQHRCQGWHRCGRLQKRAWYLYKSSLLGNQQHFFEEVNLVGW